MISKVTGPLGSVVEVRIERGIPSFGINGMSRDSREIFDQVRCAVVRNWFEWPSGRITVNVRFIENVILQHGLPIAIAILVANGTLSQESVDGIIFEGELRLDGTIFNGFNGFNNLKEVVDSLV